MSHILDITQVTQEYPLKGNKISLLKLALHLLNTGIRFLVMVLLDAEKETLCLFPRLLTREKSRTQR